MSKKVIIDEELISARRERRGQVDMVDINSDMSKPEKEIISEREPVPTAREIRAQKRDVRRQARSNRSTTRAERAMAKVSVTAIDYQPGDLVTMRRNRNFMGLVVDIYDRGGSDLHVEVMVDGATRVYRGKSLRKIDHD